MSSQLSQERLQEKAEIYHGHEICRSKYLELLKEVGMPNGLLPLEDILECGYIEETGYVWLKQKKSTQHYFDKIGKLVSYAPEVTAYVDKFRMKKVTGVKAKEFLFWISLSEICVDDPPTGKLTFKTPAGLSRSFPVSAFEVPEEKKKVETMVGCSQEKEGVVEKA
ncbi:hypothetical protein AMTRI_Chr02g220710 [Amborella trichopoda]|uniref:DUF538 domain-containing protein n=1 Tax=Amborella trichopoda TaxID=13333 RepID=W1P6B1_AMBTC|nr:uncharacterized protein LOC18431288 [Amborella trichopoda]ERN03151.1 hypothetical protein AMTR_s00003p00107900 [Amborella trichopoda]|eukprot:XP_006841476.1 uncharacterized protein LOC18431288 [Amborella trichopoda]